MKKIVLMVAAALVSTGAFAQLQWGVKAGLNLATETKVAKAKMRPGFYVGGLAEYGVNDFLSFQSELLYSQMGVRQKDSGATTIDKLNYIVLPVLAKLYVYRGISVDLGPQFGYMIADKSVVKANSGDRARVIYKNRANVNKFDASFAMGLSYVLFSRADVSARYNLGLTSNNKDVKSKNNVLALGVGYRF